MNFQFLVGDLNWQEYGGKWISPELNNGDWPYWLVIEFINFLDATGELLDGKEYVVEISAVSPEAAGKEQLQRALDCYGWDNAPSKIMEVEALHGYGIAAHLWQASGNDADILLRNAMQEADLVSGLFGFYMDRPENRIGSTGWDFISGDILRPLGL